MKKIYVLGLGLLFASSSAFSQYCAGGPSSTGDSNVESASLVGNTTNITYTGCPATSGLENQLAMSSDLTAGGTYTLDVQFGTCGGNYAGAGEAWIDFNGNQVFDAAESIGTWSGSPPVAMSNFTFTVPLNATVGSTRLRINQHEGTGLPLNPCASFTWGSSVDFSIDIAGGGDCFQPYGGNATTLTAVSADLNWLAPTGAIDYNVEWGVIGFFPGNGTQLGSTSNVAGLTTPATGLNPEGTYDFYVMTNCAAGTGVWMGPFTFTTLPLCEMPTNANSVPGAQDVAFDWTTGVSGETMWDVEWGVDGVVLGTGTMINNTLDGDLATTNNLAEFVIGLNGSTNYDWYVRAVCDLDLAGGADTVSYWVGPLEFTTVPLCPQPTNFTATLNAVADTFNIDLDWDAGGLETSWTIEYGEAGFAYGTGTTLNVSTSTDTVVDGLDPETTYDFYLIADCSVDGTSSVVGPVSVTTGVACTEVNGYNITSLTINSADLAWNAGSTETEWNTLYGEAGFDPLTEGTATNVMTTPAIAITGLDPGTSYEFYIEAVCGVDTNSVWVGPFSFGTNVSCFEPIDLDIMNLTYTATNLVFTSTASEWNIEYGTVGFMPENGEESGSVSGTTDNPYYVTGLNSSSTYQYYVQAVCGVGDVSTWAGPFTFNTPLSNDMPCDAIEVMVDAADTNVYYSFGATVDMNESLITPTNETVDASAPDTWFNSSIDNSVWFKFTAPASGNVTVSTASNMLTGYNTDLAVYEATDCGNYSSYSILGANTVANSPEMGSEIVLCGLTAGNEYLILVDGYLGNTGSFMIAVNSEDAANAGTAVIDAVCTDGSVELFDYITGESDGNGTWYIPSFTDPGASSFTAVNGSMPLTGLDFGTAYPFDYVVGSGCNMDVVSTTVTINEAVDAGGDGSATTCVSQDVDLQNHLVGIVATGGTWTDTDNATGLVNEVFHTSAVAAGTYDFEYVLDNGTCSDTAIVTVTVDACLGVDANEATALEVYPNPTNGVVTIANLNVEANATITLVDVQGKVIYTTTITNVNGNYELDLSTFENGIYIIEITSELTSQKVRVVKH